MPRLNSSYDPPFYFKNGHIQTVLPTLLRKIDHIHYRRERIFTQDDDFLDLDWSASGSDRLMIISHGLEGHSNRHYIKGMVAHANRHGWDACAWNMRGCSGETNRKPYMYHSGVSHDLDHVVRHILKAYNYEEIFFAGFSLGGNVTLKYFGEYGTDLPETVTGAVAISVPVDLTSSSYQLARAINRPYISRFLKMLKRKIEIKEQYYPDLISSKPFDDIYDFKGFDDTYTAPLHGFLNAEDYWRKASSLPYLEDIRHPVLLINAADDPFLTPACYPGELAGNHEHLYLEVPDHGGHAGFVDDSLTGVYWSEKRTMQFIREIRQMKSHKKRVTSPH